MRLAVTALILLTAAASGPSAAAADCYLTFNDGHLVVFPESCMKGLAHSGPRIIITVADGTSYQYRTSDIKSIDNAPTKDLPAITSYKFNNKYNYQVISDAVGTIDGDKIIVDVLGIGKWLTASFELSDDQAKVTVDGKQQQSNVSRLHFDKDRDYLVYYPGDLVLAPLEGGNGYGFEPYGRRYTVHADFLTDHSTAVPRIDINTVGGENITSKEVYLDAEIIIDGKGIFPSMTDSVQIKGRGHTSWSSNPDAKNPYRLKFASKKKPLGLKKGKNWVLLANKMRGSMMTNAIGMKAASLLGTPGANHMIPVDLYINGVYKGSYNFTEKVGLAGNSIEVEDESVATLIKLDCNYDEVATQKFLSTPYRICCNVKDPDFSETDETVITLKQVKERFNAMCKAVQDSTDLAAHVDIDFLARYLMLNELICNYEIFHPKSGYCYHENILDENSKFNFGPGWDFDWAFGKQTNNSYFRCSVRVDYFNVYDWGQSTFFKRLRSYPAVLHRMAELWQEFVDNDIDELCDFCEEYYRFARPSLEQNAQAECTSDNLDYAEQWPRAATWLRGRAEALLGKYINEVRLPGDTNGDGKINIDDVALLINYMLGHNGEGIAMYNTDVDGDGQTDIGDVTTLIRRLLQGN